jgi:hypothetical protein
MKYLCTFLILIVLQLAYLQDIEPLPEKMLGTWELTKYLSTNNGTGNEGPDKIKRIRVMNKQDYSLCLYDAKTGKEMSKTTGTYRLHEAEEKSFIYIECATSNEVHKMVSIDEADRLVFIWTEKFITYTEIWQRVKAGKGPLTKKISSS